MRQRHSVGDRNVIGHNITRLRQEKNIGQGELVRRIQLLGIEMNQAKLSRIEGKQISVVDKDIIAISEALGVTQNDLCSIENGKSMLLKIVEEHADGSKKQI